MNPYFCDHCGHQGRNCEVINNGYLCTRERGHSGPHIACGSNRRHHIHEWQNRPLWRVVTACLCAAACGWAVVMTASWFAAARIQERGAVIAWGAVEITVFAVFATYFFVTWWDHNRRP